MELLQQEISTFTSSNITEATAVWSNLTAYSVGAYALLGIFIYKCVAAHTNKSPETNTGVYWVKWSISNRGAMLDLSSQSKTYLDAGNLTVEFTQNQIQTIAIGNYEADTILVEVLDSLNVVQWSLLSQSSINDNVIDYWTYIYEPYIYEVDRALKIDLLYAGSKVRITFNKAIDATRTACGYLVGGTPYQMGKTLSDVNFKFNSFAVKSTDDFGTLTIIKRAVQDIVDFETIIDNYQINTIMRKLKNIYNDIIVFIVDEQDTSIYENLLTLGTVENASIIINEYDKTTLTWSVIEAI